MATCGIIPPLRYVGRGSGENSGLCAARLIELISFLRTFWRVDNNPCLNRKCLGAGLNPILWPNPGRVWDWKGGSLLSSNLSDHLPPLVRCFLCAYFKSSISFPHTRRRVPKSIAITCRGNLPSPRMFGYFMWQTERGGGFRGGWIEKHMAGCRSIILLTAPSTRV